MLKLLMRTKEMMNEDKLDEETTRMVERIVVLRLSTKHVNLGIRQLEIKRDEIKELAGLMKFEEVAKEIVRGKHLDAWAKRCSHHFTKKVKRALFEEIDNMVWSGSEKDITSWCKRNKVYDEITEEEIKEIWQREDPENGEDIRLNGKYVWETAKRVCDFINTHEEIIHITTFGEYRHVKRKVMNVIKEANNVERKRRQAMMKKKGDDLTTRIQRTKALITLIKQGDIEREEIERKIGEIFGK